MHRRTWDAETKTKIVLQELQGRPTAELCHEHQMGPSLYDQWRDQFLANASRAFEVQPCHRCRDPKKEEAIPGEVQQHSGGKSVPEA